MVLFTAAAAAAAVAVAVAMIRAADRGDQLGPGDVAQELGRLAEGGGDLDQLGGAGAVLALDRG